MSRVAVLGAGIAGLAAAHRLQELARERGTAIDVTVFDRSPRAGGCVQTMHADGLTMELGPDSLLIDKPAAANLLRRLFLETQIVEQRPEFKGARIVHRGRLHPIPPDFRLFSPTSLPALVTSGIFSPLGMARAALEPLIPKRAEGGDESLASFVRRRFGREVLDRLAQPLICGIYSGDPERLSMQATLPQFLDLEQRYGSLLRAMQASKTPRAPMRLVSLQSGLGAIVDALLERLGDAVRTRTAVTGMAREGDGWTIAFESGGSERFDGVICALPAYTAAQLLRPTDAQLAESLERIRYNSIATINLVYDAADGSLLAPSTGFVVPYIEGRRITAATFTTQKYPGRAPQGDLLLRAFAGGALQPELLERSDDELVEIARTEFAQLAGVTASPKGAVVRRWLRALPEYEVGHLDLAAGIEKRALALPGFALAGSGYRGVGIPDCIGGGEAAAESVSGYIRP